MADLSGTPPPYAGKTDLEVLEAEELAVEEAEYGDESLAATEEVSEDVVVETTDEEEVTE